MTNPVDRLLLVAAECDGILQRRVLRAAMKIAADAVLEPGGVLPGVTLNEDPLSVLESSRDSVAALLDGQDTRSPVMVAATNMPTAIATVIKYVSSLIDAIPVEGDEVENYQAFKSSLEELRTDMEAISPWGIALKEIADRKPTEEEQNQIQFPKLPKSVMPNPEIEKDKMPVIVDKDEDSESGTTLDDVISGL